MSLNWRVTWKGAPTFRMNLPPIIPTLFSDRLTLNMKELRSFETEKSQVAPAHAIRIYNGSRGTGPLIPNSGARSSWVINSTARPLFPRERTPVSNDQEAGWAPEPAWKFRRDKLLLFLSRFESRDGLAHNLHYPGSSPRNFGELFTSRHGVTW
jgi:hypothetical protein